MTVAAPAAACPACGASALACGRPADYVTGDVFGVYRCPACGVAFTWPRPASLDKYYPSRYREYSPLFARLLRLFYGRRVRRWTRGHRPGRALEVGCGPGWMLRALKERGWQVLGLERTVEQASFAARVMGIRVVVGDLEALRDEATFDLIALFHVLEHLDDPGAVLRACAARLRPGGRLIVTVPNYASWQARVSGDGWFHLDVPRHLFHFTPDALAALLREAGLTPTGVRFASWEHDPYGWVQSLQNRLGLAPNVLTRTLMGLPSRGGKLAALGLAAVLTLPATALALVSWGAKAGAIMEISAVRDRA